MDNDISEPDSTAADVSDGTSYHVPVARDRGNRNDAILDSVLLHAWRELQRNDASISDIGKTLAKISVIYLDNDTLSD